MKPRVELPDPFLFTPKGCTAAIKWLELIRDTTATNIGSILSRSGYEIVQYANNSWWSFSAEEDWVRKYNYGIRTIPAKNLGGSWETAYYADGNRITYNREFMQNFFSSGVPASYEEKGVAKVHFLPTEKAKIERFDNYLDS